MDERSVYDKDTRTALGSNHLRLVASRLPTPIYPGTRRRADENKNTHRLDPCIDSARIRDTQQHKAMSFASISHTASQGPVLHTSLSGAAQRRLPYKGRNVHQLP